MEQVATLIYANGFGDHLVTLPAVRALSWLLGGRLRMVTYPGIEALYYSDVLFEDYIGTSFKDLQDEGRSFDAEGVARRIGPCPLIISLNPWHSRSMDELLRLVRPEVSIGFDPAFDAYVPLDFDLHSADMAFKLVQMLDPSLRIEDFAGPPCLDAGARSRWAGIRESLPDEACLLAVHADTREWKEWRPDFFRAALHGFLERDDRFVAFVLGKRDTGLVTGPHEDRVIPALGLDLHTSFTAIESADLFLGIDSSMLHAADAFRTPGVGLFGATRPQEWGFRFSRHRHIDCGASMDRDAVQEVIDSLCELCASPVERACCRS